MTCEPGLWVFGYGSLMWRPGFSYDQAHVARLTGYQRSFCIYSVHYRGTPRRPGLVLGLDRGGICDGIAYHVPGPAVAATIAYLRAREQVSGVYREMLLPVRFGPAGETEVTALAYVAERAHPAYAGDMRLASQASLIRGAKGCAGANIDYFTATLHCLVGVGVRERSLERLACLIAPLLVRDGRSECASRIAAAPISIYPQNSTILKHMRPDQWKRFRHRNRMALPLEPPSDP